MKMVKYKVIAQSGKYRGEKAIQCRVCKRYFSANIHPDVTEGTCTLCINGLVDALPQPQKSTRSSKMRLSAKDVSKIENNTKTRLGETSCVLEVL